MNKAEIINQWIEDQKPVNPEDLGWVKKVNSALTFEWTLNNHVLICYVINKSYQIEVDMPDSFYTSCVFNGKIFNQGELRILMKMLNIQQCQHNN